MQWAGHPEGRWSLDLQENGRHHEGSKGLIDGAGVVPMEQTMKALGGGLKEFKLYPEGSQQL